MSMPSRGAEGFPSPFDKMFAPMFTGVTEFFIGKVSGGVDSDPIIHIGMFGKGLMNTVENIWFITLMVAGGISLAGSFASMYQPSAHMLFVVTDMLVMMATMAVVMFWIPATTMGILIPMIPFVYFGFAVLQWLILCIEAMVASPIIALGFATPSQEEYGKSMHSLMLLFNLFLRPPLMILGFVFASAIG